MVDLLFKYVVEPRTKQVLLHTKQLSSTQVQVNVQRKKNEERKGRKMGAVEFPSTLPFRRGPLFPFLTLLSSSLSSFSSLIVIFLIGRGEYILKPLSCIKVVVVEEENKITHNIIIIIMMEMNCSKHESLLKFLTNFLCRVLNYLDHSM